MPQLLRRGIATAAVVVATAGLMSACGSLDLRRDRGLLEGRFATATAKPSAATLYAQARKTALAAKSVHVKGTVKEEGTQVSFDFMGRLDGSNEQLVMRMPKQGAATVRTIGRTSWVVGDRTFYTRAVGASAAVAAKCAGRFLVSPVTAEEPAGSPFGRDLVKAFKVREEGFWEPVGTSVTPSDVNGVPAYELEAKHGRGQVFVSAERPTRLLRVIMTGPGKVRGTMTFSGWDAIPRFKAPPADMVVRP